MATLRPRRVSVAFHTSPMPPAPMGARISYGPKRVPAVRAMGIGTILPRSHPQVPYNALPFHLKGAVAILWLAAGRPLPSEKTPECTSEEKRHAPDETPTS